MQNFVCSGGLASSTVDGGLVFKEVRPVLNHALLSLTPTKCSKPRYTFSLTISLFTCSILEPFSPSPELFRQLLRRLARGGGRWILQEHTAPPKKSFQPYHAQSVPKSEDLEALFFNMSFWRVLKCNEEGQVLVAALSMFTS